ncbi:hypothetical protein EV127DRAFT_487324 [Xylaria flabelliformis]|nr:hypothetical protein EV127DRAFT_487324 [Xylaria flabelliformis]
MEGIYSDDAPCWVNRAFVVDQIAQEYEYHSLQSTNFTGHKQEDDPTSFPLITVAFRDKLLVDPDEPSGGCENALYRRTLFAVDPNNANDIRKNQAPKCNWTPFQEWAITAIACQLTATTTAAAVNHKPATYGRGHTHVARTVAGCCMTLKGSQQRKLIQAHVGVLDGDDPESRIHQDEVLNVIYWMTKIQFEKTIGPEQLDRWGSQLLPSAISLPALRKALEKVESLGICKASFWNLANVSDRKEADIPHILAALSVTTAEGRSILGQNATREGDRSTHSRCIANKCQQARRSDMRVERCCEEQKHTAWNIGGEDPSIARTGENYTAISHVWADGTGAGRNPGTVNKCLLGFWKDIANKLKCEAIKWDVISEPGNRDLRSKALSTMHLNYKTATVAIVHDKYLLNIPWSHDGTPCIALVLSPWFTRGWTALELARSTEVKALFKNTDGDEPVIKDLHKDILTSSPAEASRAHWLATMWIKRILEPVDDIGDIVTILSQRTTSKAGDRPIISALLADVPDPDAENVESAITEQILGYLGRIPQGCLLHGQTTIRDSGRLSWCTSSLDDVPITGIADGAVEGQWQCRMLTVDDTSVIRAYSDELSSEVKVRLALESWRRCLLLRPAAPSPEDPSLLVMPTKLNDGTLDCRYIGAVLEDPASEKDEKNNSADDGDEEVEGEKMDISGTPVWCTEDGIMTYTDYCVTTAKEPSGTKGEEVITQEELKGALREGKHRAIHYLVNKSVQPSSEELATLMEETAGTTVKSIYGQWSFGDAYVATSQLDEAIQSSFVVPALQYNLGKLYAMVGKDDTANESLRAAMDSAGQHKQFEASSRTSETASSRGALNVTKSLNARLRRVGTTFGGTHWQDRYCSIRQKVRRRAARNPKSLAYNTIMRVSDEDNKGEGRNFSKMENDATTEITIDRPKSTDRILDILVKALRKFEVMFHRDHLLVFMTAQNLGKRLRAHGRWAEAREKLERAVKGFEIHLRLWRDFHGDKVHWLDERARKALGFVDDRIQRDEDYCWMCSVHLKSAWYLLITTY